MEMVGQGAVSQGLSNAGAEETGRERMHESDQNNHSVRAGDGGYGGKETQEKDEQTSTSTLRHVCLPYSVL